MPNMTNLISKHNKIVLKRKANSSNTTPPCNCRVKASCPLKGKCGEKCIIYKATLTSDDSTMHYLGSRETEFKARFYNHSQSFKHQQKSNATELSKAFWLDKINGKCHKSLEKLSRKPPLTNQEQGLACCVSQKSALFSENVSLHD